jgi:hypothetical protein
VQVGVLHHRHHFGAVEGKDRSIHCAWRSEERAAPCVSAEPPGEYGAGDKRVQAYCFRLVPDESRTKPRPISQARKDTIQSNTSCCSASSPPAGGRLSRSSIRSRITKPTRITTGLSALITLG